MSGPIVSSRVWTDPDTWQAFRCMNRICPVMLFIADRKHGTPKCPNCDVHSSKRGELAL